MSDVTNLKDKLICHLISELENPGEGGVPGNVLSTAAKIVKDFQHEIDNGEDEAEASIRDQKLAKFLQGKGVQGHA